MKRLKLTVKPMSLLQEDGNKRDIALIYSRMGNIYEMKGIL